MTRWPLETTRLIVEATSHITIDLHRYCVLMDSALWQARAKAIALRCVLYSNSHGYQQSVGEGWGVGGLWGGRRQAFMAFAIREICQTNCRSLSFLFFFLLPGNCFWRALYTAVPSPRWQASARTVRMADKVWYIQLLAGLVYRVWLLYFNKALAGYFACHHFRCPPVSHAAVGSRQEFWHQFYRAICLWNSLFRLSQFASALSTLAPHDSMYVHWRHGSALATCKIGRQKNWRALSMIKKNHTRIYKSRCKM